MALAKMIPFCSSVRYVVFELSKVIDEDLALLPFAWVLLLSNVAQLHRFSVA